MLVMTSGLFRSERPLQLTKLVEQLLLHVQKVWRPAGLYAPRLYEEPVPDLDDPLLPPLLKIRHARATGGWYLIQINCLLLSKHVP